MLAELTADAVIETGFDFVGYHFERPRPVRRGGHGGKSRQTNGSAL